MLPAVHSTISTLISQESINACVFSACDAPSDLQACALKLSQSGTVHKILDGTLHAGGHDCIARSGKVHGKFLKPSYLGFRDCQTAGTTGTMIVSSETTMDLLTLRCHHI